MNQYRQYRLLEMIPGGLIWITLLLATVLSVLNPIAMVYAIIIYDFYWMVKVVYVSTFIVVTFRKYRQVMKVDWIKQCAALPGADKIYQLVIIPLSTETDTVIASTFAALAQTQFPADHLIIVLATEARFPDSVTVGAKLVATYQSRFGYCLQTIHPANLPGEIPAKGANITWAGQQAYQTIIQAKAIPPQQVLVTVLDADTCLEPAYFHYLTATYLQHPNRLRSSYQPIPMFTNNIWDAPAIMRVAATGTTFWLMSEQARPERLFTFSSHSMPLVPLLEVGWWQTNIVSDDSRIFLQCFLQYDGDYEVTPLYMPVYMDTVLADNWWSSLKNLYKQQRRWAWGSENIPYMIWNFWRAPHIPLRKRLWHLMNQLEGMWSWATASLIIFVFGYVPLWLLERSGDSSTVIAHTAPHLLSYFLSIANIGLILSVVLGTLLMPQRPARYGRWRYGLVVLQWILLPISMIIFGTIPATEAQTRLLLGKYLGFYVTEKARKQ